MGRETENQNITMKTGVVDVGGGLRGIYAAGVLDYCMEHDLRFDLGIGVSAGSANLASYAAGQIGRNYKFYTEYAFRRQYMGLVNFIFKHSFIDMDYVYGTLCHADGEYPLDYPSLRDNPNRRSCCRQLRSPGGRGRIHSEKGRIISHESGANHALQQKDPHYRQ